MALRIDSGFRKFIASPLDEGIHAYLRALDDYGSKLGLESLVWRQSREAILQPNKGFVSNHQFLDICLWRILHISNKEEGNKVRGTWILRQHDIQHSFLLTLVLSEIPHFQVDFTSSTERHAGSKSSLVMEEKGTLIATALADVVHAKGDIFGQTAWLYLDSKIRRSKMLRSRFEDSLWNGKVLTQDMMAILVKELDPSNSTMLLHPSDIGAFVQKCDQQLLSSLGPERFQLIIANTGLSLSQWTALR